MKVPSGAARRGQTMLTPCHHTTTSMKDIEFEGSRQWVFKKSFFSPFVNFGSDIEMREQQAHSSMLYRFTRPFAALFLGFFVSCAAQTPCFPDGIPQNELLSCSSLCLCAVKVLRDERIKHVQQLRPIGQPLQTCEAP